MALSLDSQGRVQTDLDILVLKLILHSQSPPEQSSLWEGLGHKAASGPGAG